MENKINFKWDRRTMYPLNKRIAMAPIETIEKLNSYQSQIQNEELKNLIQERGNIIYAVDYLMDNLHSTFAKKEDLVKWMTILCSAPTAGTMVKTKTSSTNDGKIVEEVFKWITGIYTYEFVYSTINGEVFQIKMNEIRF